jgi:hypothetical protein
MFHLFNKVYVVSDSLIDINFDRVVLSEKYGIKMSEQLDKVSYGELLMYADKFTNLGKSFDDFIKTLNEQVTKTNKRVVIYVDDKSFMEVTSNWLIRLFKNMDANTAWFIVDSYLKKTKKNQSWRGNHSSSQVELYKDVTETEFKKVFGGLGVDKVDAVFSTIKEKISLEFLIASYKHDGSNLPQLTISLEKILTRTLQEILLEIKHTVYKNQHKPNFNISFDETFFGNSTLYKSELLGKVGGASNVDIINSSAEDVKKFKDIAKQVYMNWDKFSENSPIIKKLDLLDLLRTGLTKEEVDKVLQMEKEDTSNSRIYPSSDEEFINIYLLDYVLNQNSEQLNSYQLR